MTHQDAFGGPWTQDKLIRLRDYLRAYMRIFRSRPYFETVYVDAFAGTGLIPPRPAGSAPQQRLEPDEPEVAGFIEGSARVALSIDPPFTRYLFIERSASKVKELEGLREAFPDLAARIQIVRGDANDYLTDWVGRTDWKRTRAVVFLDPCGMQVEWRLLEALGRTKAVDLWLLVPIGMGVNRLLTQNELPPKEWQDRLTRFFGTDEWLQECYQASAQGSLFGDQPALAKVVDYERLAAYFVERLATVFPRVAPNPLTQRNSRNSPMFMLTFAAANATAIKIAHYLLQRKPKR
jgi:three-Cys-motif partner protein